MFEIVSQEMMDLARTLSQSTLYINITKQEDILMDVTFLKLVIIFNKDISHKITRKALHDLWYLSEIIAGKDIWVMEISQQLTH